LSAGSFVLLNLLNKCCRCWVTLLLEPKLNGHD